MTITLSTIKSWLKGWFKAATKDSLTATTETLSAELAADQRGIIEAEAALQNARTVLERRQNFAEDHAVQIAAEMMASIDAAKTAKFAEDAASSVRIQDLNEELDVTLKELKAQYDADVAAAIQLRDGQVHLIAERLDADNEKLLEELLPASKVYETAARIALGW